VHDTVEIGRLQALHPQKIRRFPYSLNGSGGWKLRGMKRILVFTAAVIALLAVTVGTGTADQTAIPFQSGNPQTNGCSAGTEALALSDLTPYGYKVPATVDDPANGGNGDGIVCGRPWSAAEQEARLPDAAVPVVFDFSDNHLLSPKGGRQLYADFMMGKDCRNTSQFMIMLSQDGAPVTDLRPGTYWLTVDDTCANHNFHLIGPGIDDVVTTVPQIGIATTRVKLEAGTYRLYCDPHLVSFGMFTDFTVGGTG
jgi:hypothetical protein